MHVKHVTWRIYKGMFICKSCLIPCTTMGALSILIQWGFTCHKDDVLPTNKHRFLGWDAHLKHFWEIWFIIASWKTWTINLVKTHVCWKQQQWVCLKICYPQFQWHRIISQFTELPSGKHTKSCWKWWFASLIYPLIAYGDFPVRFL
jgi:hypothetical protein